MREEPRNQAPPGKQLEIRGLMQSELRELPKTSPVLGGWGKGLRGQYRYFLQVSAPIGREVEYRSRIQKGPNNESQRALRSLLRLMLPGKESGDPSQRGERCPLPWAAGSNPQRSTVGQDRRLL